MDFQVTYVWNITNQNELSETETSEICSPIFTASPDEVAHRWNVCLRWYSGNPDYYGVYIYLKDEPFHTKISMNFKIEVRDNNDELIKSKSVSDSHTFHKCKGRGNSNLINKIQYNIKNIKKIKVELKLTRPADVDITDKIPKRETVPYEWEIQNQDELSETETSEIYSPIFKGSPDEIPHLWNISIKWDSKIPDFYGIYFHLKDEPFHTKIIMGYNYKVIDDKGKVIESVYSRESHIYEKNERRSTYAIYRRKYNIKNIKKIKVELKLTRPKEINVINLRRAKVCENLLELYKSQEFSDLTIFCENRKFKVHKQILAARSPVFNRMFSSNMKENNTNDVNIQTVTADAVEVFIKFLYSGSVEIPVEHLEDILILSEQYFIKDLKNMCIYKMKNNLSIDTVIQTLIMADKYNFSDIKTNTLCFIKQNLKEVIKTEAYLENLKHHSNLFLEAMTFIALNIQQ